MRFWNELPPEVIHEVQKWTESSQPCVGTRSTGSPPTGHGSLQMKERDKGERMTDTEQGPSNEEAETDQPSLAVFVRHGQALPESH
jgi:hypothetical protein